MKREPAATQELKVVQKRCRGLVKPLKIPKTALKVIRGFSPEAQQLNCQIDSRMVEEAFKTQRRVCDV